MSNARDELESEAIDGLRELNVELQELNKRRHEFIERMRKKAKDMKAGIDLDSIRRAALVLSSADPIGFDECHERVKEMLERYSKHKLAQKMHPPRMRMRGEVAQ